MSAVSAGATGVSLVSTYGAPALAILTGIKGIQASGEQKKLAEQARVAAAAGNKKALNTALTALRLSFDRAQAGVQTQLGANGFLSSRNAGGFGSAAQAKLNTDQALQEAQLGQQSKNQLDAINLQAARDRAAAAAAGVDARFQLGGGVISGAGKLAGA